MTFGSARAGVPRHLKIYGRERPSLAPNNFSEIVSCFAYVLVREITIPLLRTNKAIMHLT